MGSQTLPQVPLIFDTTPSSVLEDARRLTDECRTAHDAIVTSVTPKNATFANVIPPFVHAENNLVAGRRLLRIYKSVSTASSGEGVQG